MAVVNGAGGWRWLASLAAVLGSVACQADDSVVEIGVIHYFGDPEQIDVPTSARVGHPFRVTITTFGDGCHSLERTEVQAGDDAIDVTPYDRRLVPSPGEACITLLVSLRHEVELVFETAGTKELRVHGRRLTYDGELMDELVEVTRPIVVE